MNYDAVTTDGYTRYYDKSACWVCTGTHGRLDTTEYAEHCTFATDRLRWTLYVRKATTEQEREERTVFCYNACDST